MSVEPEELTAVEEQALIEQLHVLQKEIHERVKNLAEATKPVDLETPIGRLSRMDAMQEQEMQKATKQKYLLRLQLIEQAIKAADNDVYGYCRKCEEPIGYARLQVRPEAPFCMECQNHSES